MSQPSSLFISGLGESPLSELSPYFQTLYYRLPRSPGEVIHCRELSVVIMGLQCKEYNRYRFILFRTNTALVHRAIVHSSERGASIDEIDADEIEAFVEMLFSGDITKLISACAQLRQASMEVNRILRGSPLFS